MPTTSPDAAPPAVFAGDPGAPGGGTGRGRGPDGGNPWKGLGAAYLMVAAVGIGVGLGLWLDRRYDTMPWWTIGLTVFFLIAGFYHLVKEAGK